MRALLARVTGSYCAAHPVLTVHAQAAAGQAPAIAQQTCCSCVATARRRWYSSWHSLPCTEGCASDTATRSTFQSTYGLAAAGSR
jgi:hypothetical protein